MAERMGFEPMKEFPLYTLSKRAPSTTRPPLPKTIFKNNIILIHLKLLFFFYNSHFIDIALEKFNCVKII